jgi:hypothetical protein
MIALRRRHLVFIGVAILGTTAALSAAMADDEVKPNRIVIEYVAPKDQEFQQLYEFSKQHRVLEKMQEIFSPFMLPTELKLLTTQCGMVNAWYQRPTLTICYEYLQDIQKNIPKGPTPAGLTPEDTVLGQFAYVVTHEMGHAMFDQLNIPLFGRPEDAADGFATYMMLRLGKEDARRLIGGAAYSYKDYFANPLVILKPTAFSDAHGAPMQRFYNLLCLAYGSDKQGYADLVEKGYLPKDRVPSCGMEWGELNFAFKELIVPHLDPVLTKAVLEKSWLPAPGSFLDARKTDLAPK